jgi:hypothetical protein
MLVVRIHLLVLHLSILWLQLLSHCPSPLEPKKSDANERLSVGNRQNGVGSTLLSCWSLASVGLGEVREEVWSEARCSTNDSVQSFSNTLAITSEPLRCEVTSS